MKITRQLSITLCPEDLIKYQSIIKLIQYEKKIECFCFASFLAFTLIMSCNKDNQEPNPTHAPDSGYINGYYIVNEGPFMTGSGTIDFVTRTVKNIRISTSHQMTDRYWAISCNLLPLLELRLTLL